MLAYFKDKSGKVRQIEVDSELFTSFQDMIENVKVYAEDNLGLTSTVMVVVK